MVGAGTSSACSFSTVALTPAKLSLWANAFIDEVLAFPHKQSTEDLQRFLDAFFQHPGTADRLSQITVPTLVLAGRRDPTMRPEVCLEVADIIPGARFEVMEDEAHQPFQEVPHEWNAIVDSFWREVGASG